MLDAVLEPTPRGRVRVARLGAGPAVLLLHGYPETLQIWSRVAPRLARRFEVFAFDWPGLGRSDPWEGGATPAHFADRLRDLMDHWRLGRAHVVGLDMGGQPALVCAARHPARVATVVALNSLVLWDEATSWEIRVLRKMKWNHLLLRRFPGLVFARAVRTFLPRGEGLTPEAREDFWSAFREPRVRRLLIRMCAGWQATLPALPEDYARIRAPALALWGEAERHFPPEHGRRLSRIVPGAELALVPGAGHWMPWHRAGEVAAALERFLVAGSQ